MARKLNYTKEYRRLKYEISGLNDRINALITENCDNVSALKTMGWTILILIVFIIVIIIVVLSK